MSSPRVTFDRAADAFVAVVGQVGAADLERPGLGEWSVRDLVGHATRALLTVEAYLGIDARADAPSVPDAATYYETALAAIGDPALVAQRGRDAGAALGLDVAAAVADVATRVRTLVASTPGSALVATPVGSMTLDAYLPTRTFELVVHSLDLLAALDLDVELPSDAVAEATSVLASLAVRRGEGPTVLAALTGRGRLPDGFSLL